MLARKAMFLRVRSRAVISSLCGNHRSCSSAGQPLEWVKLSTHAEKVTQSLQMHRETVGVAETTSGGLISTALFSTAAGHSVFRGAGIRLPRGISESAGQVAKEASEKQMLAWGIEYSSNADRPQSATMIHALELAHAAKINLGTDWGIGESGVLGPDPHPRSGFPAGIGFVAVVGPSEKETAVLKVDPVGETSRLENMTRFALAALHLMSQVQVDSKR